MIYVINWLVSWLQTIQISLSIRSDILFITRYRNWPLIRGRKNRIFFSIYRVTSYNQIQGVYIIPFCCAGRSVEMKRTISIFPITSHETSVQCRIPSFLPFRVIPIPTSMWYFGIFSKNKLLIQKPGDVKFRFDKIIYLSYYIRKLNRICI